jgi:hypothetical protein
VVIITNNISRKIRVKILVTALVMCLGLYPAAELTRVIWSISFPYEPGKIVIWIVETLSIWVMYLSIIPVMVLSIRWFESKEHHHHYTADEPYEMEKRTHMPMLEKRMDTLSQLELTDPLDSLLLSNISMVESRSSSMSPSSSHN